MRREMTSEERANGLKESANNLKRFNIMRDLYDSEIIDIEDMREYCFKNLKDPMHNITCIELFKRGIITRDEARAHFKEKYKWADINW